eukprot:793139-Prymnesium_polylepis.1
MTGQVSKLQSEVATVKAAQALAGPPGGAAVYPFAFHEADVPPLGGEEGHVRGTSSPLARFARSRGTTLSLCLSQSAKGVQ